MASSRDSSGDEEPTPQEQIGALVDERLLTLLREVFPPLIVKPGVQMDEVQHAAGKQCVIDFLALCVRHSREPD